MDIPRLYKVSALPTSPTAADDGVYFVRPNPSVGYICYIITNGVAVQQDAITTAALTILLGDFVKKDGSVPMTDSLQMDHQPVGANILRDFSTYGLPIIRSIIDTKSVNNSLRLAAFDSGGSVNDYRFIDENGSSNGIYFFYNGQIACSDATANNHTVNLGQLSNYALLSQVYTQSQALGLFVGLNGVQTIADTKTFTSSPIVPNGTLSGHTVNIGQLNTLLATKANINGNYPNMQVGYSDNSGLWSGQTYSTSASGNPLFFMVYDDSSLVWRSSSLAEVKNALGFGNYVLQTSLNAQLANYVTANGVQNITATKTFTVSPIVPIGTLSDHTVNLGQVTTLLNDKVDKVAGKQLSTEDYTSAEKTKLNNIQAGAEVNVNADWNATSGDAQILNKPTIPTNNNQLANGAGYQNASQVSTTVSNQISNLGFAPNPHRYFPVTANNTVIDPSEHRRIVAVFTNPSVLGAVLPNNAFPGTVVTLQTTGTSVGVTMDYRRPGSSGSSLTMEPNKSLQLSFSEDESAWIFEQYNDLT